VFDVEKIRRDFPILAETIHGRPLVYLDSANTSQKPAAVINAISSYYQHDNSNIHRATHLLSERATALYEGAREKVRRFINAADSREVIFVRGTTEAVNLLASSHGQSFKSGDEILISTMEHHSNIVPWQMLCQRTGAVLKVIPIDERGELIEAEFEKLLGPKTRLLSLIHVSNALGTVNPVQKMIARAHAVGVPVFLDGAQAVPHMAVDVRALDCDYYAFSGHKMCGPTGIGALYGKLKLLEALPPYHGGGDMIKSVTFEKTIYNDLPWRFEAGTANIAGGVGLGAAVDYLETIGMDAIAAHEHELLVYATEKLQSLPGLRIIGTAREKASVLSFVLEGVHPHDIGTILDSEGIAIRTGHHCAQPVMDRYNLPATARASFAFYNTKAEVDALAAGIIKVQRMFA
jgi:cysteine desulfurase/selenocysteine lyase